MESKREKRENSSEDCDKNRAEPEYSSVDHGILKIVPGNVTFLDEIKKDDGVADDDADQAGDAEKCHEPERFSHHPKRSECTDHAIWRCGQHQQWLNAILELKHQRKKDGKRGNCHDDGQVLESTFRLVVLTTDLHPVTGWNRLLKFLEPGQRCLQNLGTQVPLSGERPHVDGAELFDPDDPSGDEVVFYVRNLQQRNLGIRLRTIDVQILHVG